VSRRARFRAACSSGTLERVVQGLVGMLLAALALDSLEQPIVAALAAAFAALLLVGTVRGWCPGALLARRTERAEVNRVGIPDERYPLGG
jgi:hypothetical protein